MWLRLAVVFAFSLPALAADRPPNVVLIVADDTGYADAGCYGATNLRPPHLGTRARLSGIRGIGSRHGSRVEKLGQCLFDLTADPSEAKDVSEAHSQVLKQLTALADEVRKDLGDPLTKTTGTGVRAVGRDDKK